MACLGLVCPAGREQQESEQSLVGITTCVLPPTPSPPNPSVKKLSSTKLVPGANQVGDYCAKGPINNLTIPAPAPERGKVWGGQKSTLST